MKSAHRLLFTAISAVLLGIGLVVIVTGVHTGSARFVGIRTLRGEEAVWFGQTCLLLAVLPMLVWMPKRWIGPAIASWWVSLMAWLFVPFISR